MTKRLITEKKTIFLKEIKEKYLVIQQKSSNFAPTNRGVEQLVARQAHNLEVACSSPASATKDPRTLL